MFDNTILEIKTLKRILDKIIDDYETLKSFESIDFSKLDTINIFCWYEDDRIDPIDVPISREHWEEFRQLTLEFLSRKFKNTTGNVHRAYVRLKYLHKQPLFTPYSYPTVVIVNPLSRVKQPKKQKRSIISKPKVDLTEKQLVTQDKKPRNEMPKIQFWIVRDTSADQPQIFHSKRRPNKGNVLGGYARLTTAEEALLEILKKGG